ncbi:hypothetical protein JZ751_013767 [Albula glossodonta]|uniref:Uncharacterized protein n=1 Tax=Albula glossodonta TaxID=121402 RepID=A0A8T2P4L5_9TELE|nr:hypothetical protein JZ751_013767 [Albula glossodonta]
MSPLPPLYSLEASPAVRPPACGGTLSSVQSVLPDGVEDPVHLGGPAAVVGVVHLLHEVVQSLLLGLVQSQGLADVGDVVEGLQLWHARAQHHGEQVDEEVGVLADGQEVAEVYVEQLQTGHFKKRGTAVSALHPPVVINDCDQKSGASSTWPSSFTMMLLLCRSPIPRMKVATQYPAQERPLVERVAVELQRPLQAALALDLHDGVRVAHHLDEAHAVPDGQAPIGQHPATQQRVMGK